MSKAHEKITVYGGRLKQEAKKRGLTNDDMASLLLYSSGKQISPIYSGIKELTDDRFAILAKTWNVRENYLRCIDDWETDDDMLKNTEILDIDSFKVCKAYLETLGLRLCPFISSILDISLVYRDWEIIKEYLTDDTINEVQTKYDFSLDLKKIYKEYKGQYIELFWRKPLDNLGIDFSEVGKEHTELLNMYHVGSGKGALPHNMSYLIGFKAYYKNELLCTTSITGLQNFMQQLDSFVQCAIETLLPASFSVLDYHY